MLEDRCRAEKRLVIIGEGFRLEVQSALPDHPSREWIVPESPRPSDTPAHWRWLSTLEGQIVRCVDTERWTTAEEIARSVGENYNPEFRGILRNLVDRGILASCQGKGYRLSTAP